MSNQDREGRSLSTPWCGFSGFFPRILARLFKRSLFVGAACAVGYNVIVIKSAIASRHYIGPGTFNERAVALASASVVILVLLLGLLLKIPPVSRAWTRSKLWVVLTFCVSLVWFAFDDWDVGWGYFGLLFAIANWPIRNRSSDSRE